MNVISALVYFINSMDKKGTICLLLVLLLSFSYCECKRNQGGGGRHGGHTTPRSNHYNPSTEGSVGFDHYQRPQYNQNSRPDIGFENVQNRVPQNNQPHVQTNYNPVSNSNPSAPLPSYPQNNPPNFNSQPSPGIGFDNVHQRVPPQSNTGYNTGYNNHPAQYPVGSNPGYQHTNNPYQPPQTYYNPQYASPGGVQPQFYQPMQQSSGGSILGYAGSFAGGYLIGRLTSGGGGGSHDSGNSQYTVNNYYNNANEVPKQISVQANKVTECSQNVTQGLCVPNTFPLCLSNGTIMCVTHSTYTTPCGGVNSMACIVTVLPCVSNDTSCNNTAGNVSTTPVYIPCISNVTVSQQNQRNYATDKLDVNQNLGLTNVQYCVTAIAEPKKLESPVPSYIDFLKQFAMMSYQMAMTNNTAYTTITNRENVTDVTTVFPFLNKTEATTLPFNT